MRQKSTSAIAIRVENLSKVYSLGRINYKSFQKTVASVLAKVQGKEDPNSIIGTKATRYDKEKNNFWALRDVNFEIKRGDRVGVVGPNGAGKTTLLKIISRITEPTFGQIGINGRVASLLEVGTGFHPELTGLENIYLSAAIQGMSRQETKSKLDKIIDFSGISEFIDTPAKRYSSGMYVKLAFSVAAHVEPDILILDEVLAVGDAEFQKKCIAKIHEIAGHGERTVLFVSHNNSLVEQMCNYSLNFSGGSLVSRTELDPTRNKSQNRQEVL